jgi:hypothetical protein
MDYFDRNGKVIDQKTWSRLFEQGSYRVVNFTEIEDGKNTVVSTIWLGIPHGYDMYQRPFIFESLVESNNSEQVMLRYTTLTEAQDGHGKLVKKYSGNKYATLTNPDRGLTYKPPKSRFEAVLEELE